VVESFYFSAINIFKALSKNSINLKYHIVSLRPFGTKKEMKKLFAAWLIYKSVMLLFKKQFLKKYQSFCLVMKIPESICILKSLPLKERFLLVGKLK
jgi:hypothetical protein